MIGMDELPEAIQWHEGMLLSPHHFQELSKRVESLLHAHIRHMAPFHWGLRRWPVQYDPGLLVGGRLRILHLEAVMPDGLVVSYGFEEDEDLELDLTPHAEDLAVQPMKVYVAVPAQKTGADQGGLARYRSVDGKPVKDWNTGDDELVIPRLRPRLSLVLGEPHSKYASFPLMEVQFKNEAYEATAFLPPMLDVPVRSSLGESCLVLAQTIRRKAVHWAETVASPSLKVGSPLELEARTLIHHLVVALPKFEAIVHSGRAHPFDVYLALCEMAGTLSAFGESLIPPEFSPYDHNDVRGSLGEVMEWIHDMLRKAMPDAYSAFPFQDEEGMFTLRIQSSWAGKRCIIGVRAKPGFTEADVRAWLEDAVIGAQPRLAGLHERRILGVERQLIDRDGDLVPSRGVVLFALNSRSPYFEADEALAVVNTGPQRQAIRPLEIILFVKNQPEGPAPTSARASGGEAPVGHEEREAGR